MDANGVFIQTQTMSGTNLFALPADAGVGVSGGENLVITGESGLSFSAWSSADPTLPVTSWTLEGVMSEAPLGGPAGSRYEILLNPKISPTYYIFAQTNTGRYFPTEPLAWLTTSNFTVFAVVTNDVSISDAGVFALPVPPTFTLLPASQTVIAGQNAGFAAGATDPHAGYTWFYNHQAIPRASGPVLTLTNVTAGSAGYYVVTITNATGIPASSYASLTVTPPPDLALARATPGTIQLNANSITGLTYIVQTTTSLHPPNWISVQTNNTGGNGAINFQTNAAGNQIRFYRLVFP
jgi:hypothetical protein